MNIKKSHNNLSTCAKSSLQDGVVLISTTAKKMYLKLRSNINYINFGAVKFLTNVFVVNGYSAGQSNSLFCIAQTNFFFFTEADLKLRCNSLFELECDKTDVKS